MSTGTEAIRLSVMELGRFTCTQLDRRAWRLRVKHCHSATSRRNPAARLLALFALNRGARPLLEAVHLAPAVPADPRVKPVECKHPPLPEAYPMDTLEPAQAAIRTRSQTHLNEHPESGPAKLRVHPALLGRVGHPVDRQHIRRDPVIDAVLYRILQHVGETVHHDSV